MNKILKDSLSICHDIICFEIVERALYRITLSKDKKLDELLIQEVYDLQADLIKAKNPRRDYKSAF